MVNKYKGICFVCGRNVPAGRGDFQSKGSLPKSWRNKIMGRWLVRCFGCKQLGNKPEGEPARVIMYCGEQCHGDGFTEIEYNPFEDAVILRETNNGDTEIWLEREAMDRMLIELTDFIGKLNAIGVKTSPTLETIKRC